MACPICNHPERQIEKLTWVQVSRKLNYHSVSWGRGITGNGVISQFSVVSKVTIKMPSEGFWFTLSHFVSQKVKTCSICLCHQQYNFCCHCLCDQIMELSQGVGKLRVSLLCCWVYLFIATLLIPPGRIFSQRVIWILSHLNTYAGKSKRNGFSSCRANPCLQKGLFFLWFLILFFGKVNNETLLQIWLSPESLFKWQKINTITKSIKQFFTLQSCTL